jgi:hypothetical protein
MPDVKFWCWNEGTNITENVSLSLCLSVCLLLYNPLRGLGCSFSFLIFYTVSRTPWTGDQLLLAHKVTQTQNKRTQPSVPREGFEPTTQLFERARTVYALGRAATLIRFIVLIICSFVNRVPCSLYKFLDFRVHSRPSYRAECLPHKYISVITAALH